MSSNQTDNIKKTTQSFVTPQTMYDKKKKNKLDY